MRFTSLVIELIRARPRLVVWIVVLLQAALWLLVPLVFYRSPPGDLATVLAFGREYQVGTDLGPPLAFWLADIAFRAAGNHMFGVYVLAQCLVLLVDRSRSVAFDHVRRHRLVAAGRGICGGNRARAAHAVIIRSVVCAARDCRAGVALFDLGDPRRRPRLAAAPRGCRTQHESIELGL